MGSIAASMPQHLSRMAVVMGLVLLAPLWPAGAAGPLASLTGHWQGAVTENTLGVPMTSVELQLEPDDGVLDVRWSALGGGTMSAPLRQVPSRPEILAPAPVAQGLQALFGGTKPPNPLGGEPLVWARHDGHGLYLYRLQISDRGQLTLDRYAFEPDDSTLAFTASRIGQNGRPQGQVRASLRRAEP